MVHVHIVISDRNWILERLAGEIAKRYDYVTYDTAPDPTAQIQYYMTFGCRQGKVSAREIGYFAHYEEAPIAEEARRKFWRTAREVDYCICHSERYARLLREKGFEKTRAISPGVDFDEMEVKVKIGIVGRTYHTGRKGEDLVAQVMDIPEIDWHFTGKGWPGPAENVAPGKMGEFYNQMDYILVPALYEGGPMCVAEALACGRPVIAPPIGWVNEFEHIEYETGNAESLREVLLSVVEERRKRREPILPHSWDAWAAGHDEVFREVAATLPPSSIGQRGLEFAGPVALCLDMRELVSRGGPSMRIPRTVQHLKLLGADARLEDRFGVRAEDYELVHSFNIWPPESAMRTMHRVKAAGKPLVFSPILLDLSERQAFHFDVPNIFETAHSSKDIEQRLARLRKRREEQIQQGEAIQEPEAGFLDNVRRVVGHTDHLICLSDREEKLLEAIGAAPRGGMSRVWNPVQADQFAEADPDLFKERYGLEDYILCVGRIEYRKNQLMLLYALRDLDIPVVLIGHMGDERLEWLLQEWAGDNVRILQRMEPGSAMLTSAFRGARVFTLPSWAEGAPLAALEAAAAGCSLVLSNRSSEPEYFGKFARFLDPSNPEDMRAKILDAYENPLSEKQRHAQQEHVRKHCSWEAYAEGTLRAYQEALEGFEQAGASMPVSVCEAKRQPAIFLDITQNAYHDGPPTGIARVELKCALEMIALVPERLRLVFRHETHKTFIEVAQEAFLDGSYKALRAEKSDVLPDADKVCYNGQERSIFAPYEFVDFQTDDLFVLLGAAWIRNRAYIEDLLGTKKNCGLHLAVMIHDIARGKFTHLYPEKLTDQFISHVALLIRNSDILLTDSECSKQDIAEFAEANGISPPPIHMSRCGDEIEQPAVINVKAIAPLREMLGSRDFVLCVSAIDVRKNHHLLYNLWVRLFEEYGEEAPDLVCVGAVSWRTQDLRDLMTNDERCKGRLHILHDIQDEALDWLYSNCLFTVYPSLYEGYGIPVAESLAYGKVCIASNSSSIVEICPELTDLLDPLDFAAWKRTIEKYAFSEHARQQREAEIQAKFVPTSWRSKAQQVLENIQKPYVPKLRFARYNLGNLLSFGTSIKNLPLGSAHLAGGWNAPEAGGAWSYAPKAHLGFTLHYVPRHPLVLCCFLSRFGKHPENCVFAAVRANGRLIGHIAIYVGDWFRFVLPPDVIGPNAIRPELLIEFESLNAVIPGPLGLAKDERLLGVRLHSLVIDEVCTAEAPIPRRAVPASGGPPKPINPWAIIGWEKRTGDAVFELAGSRSVFPLHLTKIGEEPKEALLSLCILTANNFDVRVILTIENVKIGEFSLGLRNEFPVARRINLEELDSSGPLWLTVELQRTSVGKNRPSPESLTSGSCGVRVTHPKLTAIEPGMPEDLQETAERALTLEMSPATDAVLPRPLGANRPRHAVIEDAALEMDTSPEDELSTYATGEAHDEEPAPCPWGAVIRVDASGQAEPYLVSGWSDPDDPIRWTVGNEAVIELPIESLPTEAVRFMLKGRAFTAPEYEPLIVDFEINGVHCGGIEVGEEPAEYSVPVPPEAFDASMSLTIQLHIQNPASPHSLGISPDVRLLGLLLSKFSLGTGEMGSLDGAQSEDTAHASGYAQPAVEDDPHPGQIPEYVSAAPYALGEFIPCDGSGKEAPYLVSGWSSPHDPSRWTVGKHAQILLRVEPAQHKPCALVLEGKALNRPDGQPQNVEIDVNGVVCGRCAYEATMTDHRIALPPEAMTEDGTLRIALHISNPISPEELGLGTDRRPLGILLRGFSLIEDADASDEELEETETSSMLPNPPEDQVFPEDAAGISELQDGIGEEPTRSPQALQSEHASLDEAVEVPKNEP